MRPLPSILCLALSFILFTSVLSAQGDFIDVNCGFTYVDSTIGVSNDFISPNYPGACSSGKEYESGDRFFRLVTTESLNLTVTLDIDDINADLDLFFFLDPSAGMLNRPVACVQSSTQTMSSQESINITALPPGYYWVVVDGASTTEGTSEILNESGFTLTIDCGKLPDLLECNESITSTTANRLSQFDDYSNCLEQVVKVYTAGDQLYRIELDETTTIAVTVDILGSADLDLFLFNSIEVLEEVCPNVCIARSDQTGGTTEEIEIELDSGTYWAIVDGDETPAFPENIRQEGEFTISLDCGKDFISIGCGEEVEATTVGRINDFSNGQYLDCLPDVQINVYDAGDQLFRLDLTETEMVEIALNNLDTAQLDLFLLADSLVGNDHCPGLCIASGQEIGDDQINMMLDSGTYWIVVDGTFVPGVPDPIVEEGSFILSIDCGKTFTDIMCGETIDGDLAGKVNTYDSSDYQGCMFDTFAYDSGDDLYRLVVDQNTELTISLTTTFNDLAIGLFSSVLDPETQELCPGPCIIFSDAVNPVAETINAVLTPGTYWIIVDAFSDSPLFTDPYSLSVSCGKQFQDLSCNVSVADSTIGRESKYNFTDYGSCFDGGNVFNQGDRLFRLQLQEDTDLDLLFNQSDTSNPLSLFVFTNDSSQETPCPDTCFSVITGPGTLNLGLLTGTYWIIVDGAEDQFSIGVSCSPLPVRLSVFDGVSTSSANQLHWVTLSEFNSEGFNLERSSDSYNWTELAFVPAKGGSNTEAEYYYEDVTPFYGPNYYRLKMVDFDGSFEYSPTVYLEFGDADEVNVFPVPALDVIQIAGIHDQVQSFEIHNMQGATILRGSGMINNQINIERLPAGLYVLKLQTSSTDFTLKLLKQ